MLSERLGKAVDTSGLTQGQFAGAVVMEVDRLRNILKGNVKALKKNEALAIQEQFGWRELWLREGKGAQRLTKEEMALLVAPKRPLSTNGSSEGLPISKGPESIELQLRASDEELSKEFVFVPRYDVTASAGGGAQVYDESIVDYLAFKKNWVLQMGLDPGNLLLAEVRGDSMSPTINHADLVMLDTRQSRIKSEGVYMINLRGVLLVKRLQIKINGVVEVVSDNKKYEKEVISGEELERLIVVGQIVWHVKKI
jgi:phage repressor protein C with HTH and peptisase S24 domain